MYIQYKKACELMGGNHNFFRGCDLPTVKPKPGDFKNLKYYLSTK